MSARMTPTRKILLPALAATLALPAGLSAASAANSAAPARACAGSKIEDSGFWITIIAENVRSSEGLLTITVYPDKRSQFLAKGGSINVGRIKAQKGTTQGCVFLPSDGVYAIALYHDENGNHKFDRGLLPEEGYGFSNDANTVAGLPSFKSVRLAVPKNNMATKITMKYP